MGGCMIMSAAAATGTRRKILMIDDEFGPRESVRFVFKNEYQVFCEDSVDSGVERLKKERPDVVILDIRMPGKTGIEGLRAIREVDPDVSIVMLTGFGSIETAREAMRFGANDYIKKPFDTTEMRDVVKRHIERTEMARLRSRSMHDLEDLNVRLRNEARAKEQLAELGMASTGLVHDLRSPLTAIYGYVQLLMDDVAKAGAGAQQGGNTGETIEYLQAIASSVKRCQGVADVWRSLGKVEGVDLVLRDIGSLVGDAAEAVQPLASSAGVKLSVAMGPGGCDVMCEPRQLYRALQNLLQNAVQAVNRGAGHVEIGWRRMASDSAEIWVADDGPGLPASILERIGQPNVTTKSAEEGMGIGLYITKLVVERTHSGRFSIVNQPGSGARASIELKLAGDEV